METGRQEIETDSSIDLSCGYCCDCRTTMEMYLNGRGMAVLAEKYPREVVNMHCSDHVVYVRVTKLLLVHKPAG